MELKGKKIYIKNLELKDVYYFRNWGFHENTLLKDYDFIDTEEYQVKKWYRWKTFTLFSKYYAINSYEEERLGYLSIKGINYLTKSSELGLVIDPNFCGKKIGSEALQLFLEYYFSQLKMKSMFLEVASYNIRALKLYKKMGFREEGEFLYEYPNDEPDRYDPYYLKEKDKFIYYKKKLYAKAYRMKLSREDFLVSR